MRGELEHGHECDGHRSADQQSARVSERDTRSEREQSRADRRDRDARFAVSGCRSMKTQVLVVGAGPAGAAAAAILAPSGGAVVLAGQYRFPRDKVCGDALIPDALRALDRLGLRHQICAQARLVRSMRLYAPDGAYASVAGDT